MESYYWLKHPVLQDQTYMYISKVTIIFQNLNAVLFGLRRIFQSCISKYAQAHEKLIFSASNKQMYCFVLKKCNFVTGILLPVYKNYYSSQIWQEQIPVFFICTILFKNKWQRNCKYIMQFIIFQTMVTATYIVNRSELIVYFLHWQPHVTF